MKFQEDVDRFEEVLRPLCALEKWAIEKALYERQQVQVQKKEQWLRKHLSELRTAQGEGLMDCVVRVLHKSNLAIDEEDMEIEEKNADKLAIRFSNPCPILEACKKLNLDTRVICRRIFEEPIRVIVGKIGEFNPHDWLEKDGWHTDLLMFERDYAEIRPYSDFGREIITRHPIWVRSSMPCNED